MLRLWLQHSVTANQGNLLLTFQIHQKELSLLDTGNTTLVGTFLDVNHHSTVSSATLRIHCSCPHHLHEKRGYLTLTCTKKEVTASLGKSGQSDHSVSSDQLIVFADCAPCGCWLSPPAS